MPNQGIANAVLSTCRLLVPTSFVEILLALTEYSEGYVSIDVSASGRYCRIGAKGLQVTLFPGHEAQPRLVEMPEGFVLSLALRVIRDFDAENAASDGLVNLFDARLNPRLRIRNQRGGSTNAVVPGSVEAQ